MLSFFAALLLVQSFGSLGLAQTTSTSACTPGSVFVPGAGRTCTKYCGVDRAGNDYASQRYASIDGNGGCLQACANDPRCTTAQYNEDNQFCYLKYSRNTNVTSSNTDTIDCTPACQQAIIQADNRRCEVTCGQDRPGGDYDRLQVASSSDCAAACAADSDCWSAQFNKNNGFCYLKNQLTQAVASSSTDSVACIPDGYCGNTYLQLDNDNCGVCGHRCADNEFCDNSQCIPRWNLCTPSQQWQPCGSTSDCLCWATKEGDGVCLPHGIYDDNGCETSRDCKFGTSCWGPWGGPGSWGLCVAVQNYVPECRNGANPRYLFTRGTSPRHKRLVDGHQYSAIADLPIVTITDSSGESFNVTVASS